MQVRSTQPTFWASAESDSARGVLHVNRSQHGPCSKRFVERIHPCQPSRIQYLRHEEGIFDG